MNIKCSLTELPADVEATITGVNEKGKTGRRLFDVGFMKGNTVVPLFSDIKKSITAYRVSGAVIALRNSIGNNIFVEYSEVKTDEH